MAGRHGLRSTFYGCMGGETDQWTPFLSTLPRTDSRRREPTLFAWFGKSQTTTSSPNGRTMPLDTSEPSLNAAAPDKRSALITCQAARIAAPAQRRNGSKNSARASRPGGGRRNKLREIKLFATLGKRRSESGVSQHAYTKRPYLKLPAREGKRGSDTHRPKMGTNFRLAAQDNCSEGQPNRCLPAKA